MDPTPAYLATYRRRNEKLLGLRKSPAMLAGAKLYYKENPVEFIKDWGVTYDPREIESDMPSLIPFTLFPKQEEWVRWAVKHWRDGTPGITEKSRDVGLSWLCVSLACTLCLFYDGFAVGFGSRKEEYVDRIGSPKSLFYKARMFMDQLPREFRGGWRALRDAPHMRINFPDTGSNISGEAGDNIGRGDRTSIYFVDEAAYLEHPDLVEAALSNTTNCRLDVSSANGMGNAFAQKRHSGKIDVFTFHWRDDPRKDDAWYKKKCDEINNPVIVASEIDIDYSASIEGVLIPSAWVQAAVDAHIKLGLMPSGERFGALDVADEGADRNAFIGGRGIVIEHIEEWSGKGSDIYDTVLRAFALCDDLGYRRMRYDSDGLGAGVRGDARRINEDRKAETVAQIRVEAYRGSEAVLDPDQKVEKNSDRTNKDYFANRKAQAWWDVRRRFQQTYRAIVEGMEYDPDEIISIPSILPMRAKLVMELSQPTYALNGTGKIVVDKKPDGTSSPNLADSVVMRYARGPLRMHVTADQARASAQHTPQQGGMVARAAATQAVAASKSVFGITGSMLERSRRR